MKIAGKTLVAMGCAALFAAGVQAADPIRIGSVLSATGPGAFLGDPEVKTMRMYVDKINAEGGVLGRKIELVSYDDGTDANKANGFVKRLLADDKVDIIVGGTTTGSTMAMAPEVEKAGVPFISLAGAAVIIEPVKKWVFKTPHTDRMAVEKVFEDMKKRGFTKVALLVETSAFGQGGGKEARAHAAKYGLTLVAQESYGPKDTEMTPQLTKIKGSGAQALLVSGFGQGPSIVTKNYGQLGMSSMPLYQLHGVASKQYIALSGPAAEGVRLPAAGLVVAEQLPANDPQKKVTTDYTKAFKDKWNQDVSTFGGHAYDGLMIAVDAIKRAGGTDKAKVRDAIEQTRGYMGTGGMVNMSATDHMGLGLDAFRMLEVRNGAFTLAK
ncbi:MAG TPA: ABC transporter substrate-binding protein [Rhodocyclaceae bacterium]|nr:MAG: ABC transporter substrate-binding protein [Betaproteobacteria bacterium CG2_30_68_42]PJA58519.1 MAG: ABC transporter substrate-binding protein [Rhodocyclales bacterium CG_4_9_14_3_um_filter_68_10]HCX34629.1 ABC transporter substrate-binding protein [Rhodocyclaceae bacterium]